MDHVALTLDGSIDERPGHMRWMPPEQAAAWRDVHQAKVAAAWRDIQPDDHYVPAGRRPQ